ncbi:MAG: MogA/MoaB family molybdenum cofactor biosynthesis protein [Acidobacteriaceae bacterium]
MTNGVRKGLTDTAAVLTVSDSGAQGVREDLSGPAVAEVLQSAGFVVVDKMIVSDDRSAIEGALRHLATEARLVVTTGGTGIAQRDVTPEATRAVCDRVLEGVGELMRAEGRKTTPLAVLSRGICGTLGDSLVLNLPGSPKGAVSSLRAALPVIPHALDLLAGRTQHAPPEQAGKEAGDSADKGSHHESTRSARKVESA